MKFAEFQVGQVIEAGPLSLSERDIIEFAERWDPQWFHTDPAAAAEGRHRGLIASGWQTCGVASGSLLQKWSLSSHLGHIEDTCVFLSPKPGNDTMTSRAIWKILRNGGSLPTPFYSALEGLKNEGIPSEKWLDVARKQACLFVPVEMAASEFWKILTGLGPAVELRTLVNAYRNLPE